MSTETVSLRSLLGLIEEDGSARRLAGEGGHAFVSRALRPYMIAALSDLDESARSRPTLVVVGDDRGARDLAADLRAWLAPPCPPTARATRSPDRSGALRARSAHAL